MGVHTIPLHSFFKMTINQKTASASLQCVKLSVRKMSIILLNAKIEAVAQPRSLIVIIYDHKTSLRFRLSSLLQK